jgi:hypothetical protein
MPQWKRIGGNRLGPWGKKKRRRRRVGGPRAERGRERGREGFVFFNPFTHKTFSSFQKLF